MAKSGKKQKVKLNPPTVRTAHLSGKRRGAILKYETQTDVNGQIVKYSFVYINGSQCARDNGRVLGYDNSHGEHHKHECGKYTPIDFPGYDALAAQFEAEVKELWRQEDEQGY